MTVDMRLVHKGKSEPRQGLVEQGKVHVALAKQYAEALIESGWSDEDTAELEKNVMLLEPRRLPEWAAGDEDNPQDPEFTAVGDAKVFIRRLRNALPRVLRETSATNISPQLFEVGERLGRSTETIQAYLGKIRPMVERLDGDLARHFAGKKASELLDSINDGLRRANPAAGSSHKDENEEALAYYELKGRVLEGIEDLNRAGRIAFEGQAEVVGKFNKDLLLRARRDRASVLPVSAKSNADAA